MIQTRRASMVPFLVFVMTSGSPANGRYGFGVKTAYQPLIVSE